MSGANYKFVLNLTAKGRTGIELSGTITEFAKDAILKIIMTDANERVCAAAIKDEGDKTHEPPKPA